MYEGVLVRVRSKRAALRIVAVSENFSQCCEIYGSSVANAQQNKAASGKHCIIYINECVCSTGCDMNAGVISMVVDEGLETWLRVHIKQRKWLRPQPQR